MFDPRRYPALAERKPGALDQAPDRAAPLQDRDPPAAFAGMRRLPGARMGPKGEREFIPRPVEAAAVPAVAAAVTGARSGPA